MRFRTVLIIADVPEALRLFWDVDAKSGLEALVRAGEHWLATLEGDVRTSEMMMNAHVYDEQKENKLGTETSTLVLDAGYRQDTPGR